MTEIVAAHLERAARELVEAAEHTNKWTFVAPVRRQLIEGVAAALAACAREEREQLAAWMIQHSFATGHGDTFEDLLRELHWQVFDLRIKLLERAAGGEPGRGVAGGKRERI